MIWWMKSRKEEYQIRMPDVGEYAKENLLAFEKEVLGIYISGHPLEEYEDKWRKTISATTLDFQPDEDSGHSKVHDGAKRDYRRNDHGQDCEAHKDEPDDGLCHGGRPPWYGRSCSFSQRL